MKGKGLEEMLHSTAQATAAAATPHTSLYDHGDDDGVQPSAFRLASPPGSVSRGARLGLSPPPTSGASTAAASVYNASLRGAVDRLFDQLKAAIHADEALMFLPPNEMGPPGAEGRYEEEYSEQKPFGSPRILRHGDHSLVVAPLLNGGTAAVPAGRGKAECY